MLWRKYHVIESHVHDDMLLSRSTLEKVGTSEWIMSAGNVRGVPPDVRLYKNGSFVTENINLIKNYWKYWPGCRRKLYFYHFKVSTLKNKALISSLARSVLKSGC